MPESKKDILERIHARKGKHRMKLPVRMFVMKAEVTPCFWEQILNAAQDLGLDVRKRKGIWLSVMDFELDDPPGPEAVELAEEEHCGGG